ncbi:MAG TPA: hypothetical protein VJT32_09790 [bacterium]|nr:hypothetical protein [bacterium]
MDWRPYHAHDRIEPLAPGGIDELDVEIWPTSVFGGRTTIHTGGPHGSSLLLTGDRGGVTAAGGHAGRSAFAGSAAGVP